MSIRNISQPAVCAAIFLSMLTGCGGGGGGGGSPRAAAEMPDVTNLPPQDVNSPLKGTWVAKMVYSSFGDPEISDSLLVKNLPLVAVRGSGLENGVHMEGCGKDYNGPVFDNVEGERYLYDATRFPDGTGKTRVELTSDYPMEVSGLTYSGPGGDPYELAHSDYTPNGTFEMKKVSNENMPLIQGTVAITGLTPDNKPLDEIVSLCTYKLYDEEPADASDMGKKAVFVVETKSAMVQVDIISQPVGHYEESWETGTAFGRITVKPYSPGPDGFSEATSESGTIDVLENTELRKRWKFDVILDDENSTHLKGEFDISFLQVD